MIGQTDLNLPLQPLIHLPLALRHRLLLPLIKPNMRERELPPGNKCNQYLPTQLINMRIFLFQVANSFEPKIEEQFLRFHHLIAGGVEIDYCVRFGGFFQEG